MITRTLTGNTRCRVVARLFRDPLLVLQVEVHRKGYEVCGPYGETTMDFDDYVWRDAKLEDLKVVVNGR